MLSSWKNVLGGALSAAVLADAPTLSAEPQTLRVALPADGRPPRGLARQADLDLHPARRARLARRQAGDGGGLHRLAQALGRPRHHGTEAAVVRRRLRGAGRKDHPDDPEGALWARAPHARQARRQRAGHDAEARRRHRSQPADHRLHRLGAVHVQERGLEGRREGRLRQEREIQAALGPALRPRRSQGGEGRPRRVAVDRRHAAPDRRPDQGEIDYIEAPPHDLLPLLQKDPNVELLATNPYGRQYAFRFNTLHKPFDNPKIRQAVAYALNGKDLLDASIGDPKWYRECKSLFPCGSPLESTAGWDDKLSGNAAKARQLLQEAGYDGTPIVLMQQTDIAVLKDSAPVAKQLLEKAGFKVDLQSMDWQTLVSRRAKKDPPSAGGWHAFVTTWSSAEVLDPVSTSYLNASC